MRAATIKRLSLNVFGCFILAMGIELTGQAGLATSGAAGLSLTFLEVIPLPFYVLFFLINLPFFILSLWKLGAFYTLSSLFSVTVLSVMTILTGQFISMDVSVSIGSIVGGFLVGVGAVVIFLSQSSMGGATILAVYLQQRNNIDPGKVIFSFDTTVVLISFLLLGVQNGFLTIFNIFVCSIVISLSKKAINKSTAGVVKKT